MSSTEIDLSHLAVVVQAFEEHMFRLGEKSLKKLKQLLSASFTQS